MTRAALVLLRLVAAGEVFRVGYLVGSYRQGMDCMQRLVSLRTPLGGEIASIIRHKVGGLGGRQGGITARVWRQLHTAGLQSEQEVPCATCNPCPCAPPTEPGAPPPQV